MIRNDQKLTFPKEERLSWKRYIDLLFAEGRSFIIYPLRVVYLPVACETGSFAVLVNVSKKRIKAAVRRNVVKRRIRESFRLRKETLKEAIMPRKQTVYIAFLYLDKEPLAFDVIDKAMAKAIPLLIEKTA